MPESNVTGKVEIKEWFSSIFRKGITVMDFGCGPATYPKLLGKRDILWIGIEIWEPYIKQFNLRVWYDIVLVSDLRTMAWPWADCAIFGDVLEHMSKEDAIRVMRRADEKFEHIVLSIPIYNSQGPTENPYEEHKYWWTWDELEESVPKSFKTRLKIGDPKLVPDIPLQGVFMK